MSLAALACAPAFAGIRDREPIDKPVLPCAKRHAVAICQATGHVTSVTQCVVGMAAITLQVHLDIGDT